jgi:hypothetical protein
MAVSFTTWRNLQRDRDRLNLLVRDIAEALGCTREGQQDHIHGACCLERIEELKEDGKRVAELTEALEVSRKEALEEAAKLMERESKYNEGGRTQFDRGAVSAFVNGAYKLRELAQSSKQLRSGEMVEAIDLKEEK